MGNLHASAAVEWTGLGGSVTGASGALAAKTATQVELGGPGGGTNPEELLAAAHANCFTSTLTALARHRDLPLERIHTTATTTLVWTDDAGDHNLSLSALEVRISSSAPWTEVERLVEETERECPVCRAISGKVAMKVTLSRL